MSRTIFGWFARSLVLLCCVIVAYVLYWVGIFSFFVNDDSCFVTHTQVYASPDGRNVAELTYGTCGVDEKRKTKITAWLSDRSNSRRHISIFIGYFSTNERVDEHSFGGVHLTWLGDSSVQVSFPSRMTLSSEPDETLGIHVKYVPIGDE